MTDPWLKASRSPTRPNLRTLRARPRKRLNQAKTVAAGCDQLPFEAHGKEGVDGSSPSEGFAKAAQIAAFSVEPTCTVSSMRRVWSRLWSFQVQNPALASRARRTGARHRKSPMATMKSVHTGEQNEIDVVDIERPVPGPKDALARIRACGICGTDVSFLRMGGIPFGPGGSMISLPLGHEPAGEIVEMGSEVTA